MLSSDGCCHDGRSSLISEYVSKIEDLDGTAVDCKIIGPSHGVFTYACTCAGVKKKWWKIGEVPN